MLVLRNNDEVVQSIFFLVSAFILFYLYIGMFSWFKIHRADPEAALTYTHTAAGTLIPDAVEPTALPTTAVADGSRTENNESSTFDWWIILVVILLLLLLLLLFCCWKRRHNAPKADGVDPVYGTVIPQYSIDRENPAYAGSEFGCVGGVADRLSLTCVVWVR